MKITNFRAISALTWYPAAGINCLIGSGDAGKSTVLDAIELCLGAKRNVLFSDSDFCRLNVAEPIVIEITVGELSDDLKRLDTYGLYLRGFKASIELIEDEPDNGAEVVLTIRLEVGNDLEPNWFLFSERADAQGQNRNLSWADRMKVAPTRFGSQKNFDLSWRKGSIVSKLTDEDVDATSALAQVSREARLAFGEEANDQLVETRAVVTETAAELGIDVGNDVKALLDASLTIGGGTISLHTHEGVPLSSLGTGSSRLLLAGLQRKMRTASSVVLIDEVEHGLEPHRLIRLLSSLGSKDEHAPLQAFLTTHSPVVVKELTGAQLFVLREMGDQHEVISVGIEDEIQGTIRQSPEAFLAISVVVCEGATEVGFLRGIDRYRVGQGKTSIMAEAVALADAGGITNVYKNASSIQAFKGRVSVFRDDDRKPLASDEAEFIEKGGRVFSWPAGCAIEDAIFASLTSDGIQNAIQLATVLHSSELVDAQIKSASSNKVSLGDCIFAFSDHHRGILAQAAKSKANPWFKSISAMETLAFEVVAPDVNASQDLVGLIQSIFEWTHDDA